MSLTAATQSSNASSDPVAKRDSGAAHDPAFGVVSIRPSKTEETDSFVMIPKDGNEYIAENRPLWYTIEMAYLPPRMTGTHGDKLMLGAPDWVWKEKYSFVGKVDDDYLNEWKKQIEHRSFWDSNEMLQAMLQAALKQRCRLVAHLAPGEINGYALVVAKNGPDERNLKPAPNDEKLPEYAQEISGEGDPRMVPILRREGEQALTFIRTSMIALADQLSMSGMPVIDRTGLTGRYDFKLPKLNDFNDPGTDWDLGYLGLKLVKAKIPASTLVIDHIERPSPN